MGTGQMGQGAQIVGLGLAVAAALTAAIGRSHCCRQCYWEVESSCCGAPASLCTHGWQDWLHVSELRLPPTPGLGRVEGPTRGQIKCLIGLDPARRLNFVYLCSKLQ